MSRRTFERNAFETGLAAGIGAADSSVILDSVVGLTAPGYMTLDPTDPLLIEIIKFTTINVNTLENLTRGLAGSAGGTGQAHALGARARMTFKEQHLDDLFDDIEDLEQADTDHEAAANPHPVYLTEAEGDVLYVEEVDHDKALHDALGIEAADSLLLQGQNLAGLVTEAEHDKALHDALGIDADTVDGQDAADFAPIGHVGDGGAAHADAVSGGADGFMLGTDKSKLNAIPDITGFGSTPDTITPDQGQAGGSNSTVSRNDHRHDLPAGPAQDIQNANSEGTGAAVARSDHKHRIFDARLMVIDGSVITVTSPSVLSASFVTKASASIPRPTGWSSALVIVTGHIQYANGAASAQLTSRITIDTSTGTTSQSGVIVAGGEAIAAPQHSFVTSEATINIALQARHEGISPGTGKYVQFMYLLIKTS
jgi:hypothetical protein